MSTAAQTAPVQVGDFFVSTWGYDQTNVDFYKVVGVTPSGKSVKVQAWRKAYVEHGGPHDSVIPGDGPVQVHDHSGVDQSADFWTRKEQVVVKDAPVETKRIKVWGQHSDNVAFTVNSYASASKWDGKPKYQTGHGYGH